MKNITVSPETWAKMDKFDKDWVERFNGGEDLSAEKEKIEGAANDHFGAGNFDVADILYRVITGNGPFYGDNY